MPKKHKKQSPIFLFSSITLVGHVDSFQPAVIKSSLSVTSTQLDAGYVAPRQGIWHFIYLIVEAS